jgi:hypothetical protein
MSDEPFDEIEDFKEPEDDDYEGETNLDDLDVYEAKFLCDAGENDENGIK